METETQAMSVVGFSFHLRTFTGGPHYMHEHQQDAMTYVCKNGWAP